MNRLISTPFALMVIWAVAAGYSCHGETLTVLYSFSGAPDGDIPTGQLLLAGNTLYGTTRLGGSTTNGTVFGINADGTEYNILYSFAGPPDGAEPDPGLVLSGSTLYGLTVSGGLYYNGSPYGTPLNRGTVFQVNTDGSGYAVLYNFAQSFIGTGDGSSPYGTPVLSGNTLYGTTYWGGESSNWGTVWEMNTDGTGYALIYSFTGLNGQNPHAGLVLSGSTLFGTTYAGGSLGWGTVFRINTDGTGEAVMKSFAGQPDGARPVSGLVLSGNALYGTTYQGGTSNLGTIFRINTDGTGYAVLKSFVGRDGAAPTPGLALVGSTLYGTTFGGGSSNRGTVFKINTDGSNYTVVHSFTNTPDGAAPGPGLVLAGDTLYGTTSSGGNFGHGTIFKLSLPPSPIPLDIQQLPGKLILTWTNAAFSLQSAPEAAGTYTNVPNAMSPYTNRFAGARQFFRLAQ